MSKKSKHLRLTPEEVKLSRLFFEWAEIWFTDEETHELSNKAYRDFLNKHRKVKKLLNPITVRKLLAAYDEFCDAVSMAKNDKDKHERDLEKFNEDVKSDE